MEERRKLERFPLRTMATIDVEVRHGRKRLGGLMTKDISSGGAFVLTTQPITRGAKLRMEFSITVDTLRRLIGEGATTKVLVDGTVVRAGPEGVAIKFDKRFTMVTAENDC